MAFKGLREKTGERSVFIHGCITPIVFNFCAVSHSQLKVCLQTETNTPRNSLAKGLFDLMRSLMEHFFYTFFYIVPSFWKGLKSQHLPGDYRHTPEVWYT